MENLQGRFGLLDLSKFSVLFDFKDSIIFRTIDDGLQLRQLHTEDFLRQTPRRRYLVEE